MGGMCGSPIHRGGALKDFLASGASKRLELEQLPGGSTLPTLILPEEGIWKHLKCVESWKNLCCESLAELKVELRKALRSASGTRETISSVASGSQALRFRCLC